MAQTITFLDNTDKNSIQEQLDSKAPKTDVSSPYNFKGTTTVGSLPASGNAINDTYYCTDAKCKYTWNGKAWYQSSLNESDYEDELSGKFDKANVAQSTGDSEDKVMSQKAATDALLILERDKYTDEMPLEWTCGEGLASSGGGTTINSERASTGFIEYGNLLLFAASGTKVCVFYYDQNKNFIASSRFQHGLFRVIGDYTPENAEYIKFLFGYDDDRDLTDASEVVNSVSVFGVAPADDEMYFNFTTGAIDASGEVGNNQTRLHTDEFISIHPLYFVPDGIKYMLAFYDANQAFLSRSRFSESPTFIDELAPEGSVYFRVVIGDVNDININRMIPTYTNKFHAYLKTSDIYSGANGVRQSASIKENKAAIEENKAAIAAIEEEAENINALSNGVFHKTVDADFVLGGIQISSSGDTNSLTTRIRTDFIDELNLKITASDDVRVWLAFYAADGAYISGASYETTSALYAITVAPEGAGKVRIMAAYTTGEEISDVEALASKIVIKSAAFKSIESEYKNDIPENIGVLNAILNYKQLIEVEYETLGVIPHATDGFMRVGKYRGIPYSSTRPEALFVPNNVSLHTFLTAVKNPNSYLYTVDLGEQGNINGDTYYGAVCSTSIGYAFNIPMYSTHQWATIPDMEIIENQSAYGLKLCDTIVGKGHVVMVTDITRNKRGKIGYITISEASNPRVKSTNYTPEELEERFPPADYTYCRYKKLYAVKHTQSPYVAVEDETPQEVTYNTAIIPRRGDKANWLVGTDVEIDVLEAGSYTSVEIYKDGALFATKDIAALITLSGLGYGSYKARLTDGTNTSEWCYWMMIDAVSAATPVGADGKVNVTFSASNATPIYVQWASGTSNGTAHITELTAEEKAAGAAVCTNEAGSFKVRVAFQTDYGIIFSVLPDAITVV